MPALTRNKLTRRFLMSLDAGLYIASNVCDRPGEPAFQEEVAAVENREAQWLRVKAARVNGCLCEVFTDHAAFSEVWSRRRDQST